ncbi:ribosomal RNA large subunit methyltransferase F-like protein [Terfezia claveryi]|nr:ribosomal RNA large subunit methyltransferase F-like protein [Terfezia claveryi]
MHERNIYRAGVDFAQLGKDCPQFAKYLVKGPSQIDFHDPDAVRELTTSLLKRDFNLTVDLPNDRLCPPVPNRLNYIHWLQDLLDSTSGGESDEYDSEREVVGLDIGVGASCIYPLLGCATRPNWKFVGTGTVSFTPLPLSRLPNRSIQPLIDIDPLSLCHAQRQLTLNSLHSRIHLIPTHPAAPFFSPALLVAPQLDFTMCNPPFYHSPSPPTITSSSLPHLTHLPTPITKLHPPNTSPPQATQSEMSIPGGELPFVRRILHESALPDVRTRVQWFSVMLGVKSHVVPLVDEIKKVGGEGANFAVTTFIQGRGGGGQGGGV